MSWYQTYGKLIVLLIVLALSLGLAVIGYGSQAQLLLATVSGIATIPIALAMVSDIRKGNFGIDILAVTAILAALALGEFLAALVVLIMLSAGEALEAFAQERARAELGALTERAPTHATVRRDRQLMVIPVDDITVGDTVIIKPGEIVPVDGTLTVGESEFDEAALTGEPLPVAYGVGDKVLSGSINSTDLVEIEASATSSHSQYEQIVALVREAASSRSPLVRLADRYSIWFTALSLGIAIVAWVLSGDPMRFLEVLVVATPCPLLIATPVALVSGMSRAARHGIIIKSGGALERLSRVRSIAFDKTGTLTRGVPTVLEVVAVGGTSRHRLLELVASLESGSNHVLAQAILNEARRLQVKIHPVTDLEEVSGRGVSGNISGDLVIAGRSSYMQDHAVANVKQLNLMSTHVAVNGSYVGYISFSDELRHETPTALQQISSLGITHTYMLTGDHLRVAKRIAKASGIKTVHADLLPAQKLEFLRNFKRSHGPVAMVGDGINDAPTLAAADVGIALGARGSTVASESADVVIMLDDLTRVPLSIVIARRTIAIALQSIRIGIGLSIILMIVAAAGFIRPVPGAVLQEAVDALVIVNALRAHHGRHHWR